MSIEEEDFLPGIRGLPNVVLWFIVWRGGIVESDGLGTKQKITIFQVSGNATGEKATVLAHSSGAKDTVLVNTVLPNLEPAAGGIGWVDRDAVINLSHVDGAWPLVRIVGDTIWALNGTTPIGVPLKRNV